MQSSKSERKQTGEGESSLLGTNKGKMGTFKTKLNEQRGEGGGKSGILSECIF